MFTLQKIKNARRAIPKDKYLEKGETMKYPGYTKFKAWMKENEVKNCDIANLLGITEGTASKKTNGLSDFTIEEIRTICLRYSISADTYFIAYKVS